MVDALSAANAYKNQLKMMSEAKDPSSQDDAEGTSFAKMVENAVQGAANTQHSTEALETQALTSGKVDLSDLVTAVANAELTLSTVVAVRDRVIGAYNDIIKMAI